MNKIFGLLGLAKRASKLVVGTDIVLEKLPSKTIKILFVASDASLTTIDKIERKGYFYNIPVIKSFSSEQLNNAIGCANVKVLGVADQGFAKAMSKELGKVESENN